MIQTYKLNSYVFSMHGDLLLLSLDSVLLQVRTRELSRSVHQLYSPFFDSLDDLRCLYTSFTSYKNASNSTTPKPSDNTQARCLDQLHLTSLLPWVGIRYYGLSYNKLLITWRRVPYTRYWHCMMSELSSLSALELLMAPEL